MVDLIYYSRITLLGFFQKVIGLTKLIKTQLISCILNSAQHFKVDAVFVPIVFIRIRCMVML